MAIQNRRGAYNNFSPSKMVPGEFAVVQSGDPNGSNGQAAYIAFQPGQVKRLATNEDIHNEIQAETQDIADALVDQIETEVADDVQAAQTAATNAQTAATTAITKASEASASATQAAQTVATIIDNTLTQTGKAADAKVTGDRIAQIIQYLPSLNSGNALSLEEGTNLDELITAGNYRVTSGARAATMLGDLPFTNVAYRLFVLVTTQTERLYQIAFPNSSGTTIPIKFRRYMGTSWTSWMSFATEEWTNSQIGKYFPTGGVESSSTASKNYAVGDLLVTDGTLYKVTSAITTGSTITVGTNVAVTTVEAELKARDAEIVKKADPDGNYTNLTAGNAEQLVATVGVTDKVPYNFRASCSGADIGNRLTDMLVGGTVAWNQLIPKTTSSKTQYGITFTGNGDGSVTVNGQITGGSNYPFINMSPTNEKNFFNNHVYYTPVMDNHLLLRLCSIRNGSTANIVGSMNDNIVKPTTFEDADTGAFARLIARGSAELSNVVVKPQIFDLTQMFGSTIADYIYNLEQATAGAGVALFRRLFPKDYYDYNPGELISVQTSAHKTVGFNAFDGVLESGTFSSTTGAKSSHATYYRSPNFIPVLSGETYYHNKEMQLFYYTTKAASGFIQYAAFTAAGTFVIPDGAKYLRFVLKSNMPDACINLSHSGYRNGEYEPYKENVYPLDSDLVLRGIPKLDANNQLYYDGDTYESDGTVTRKYGVVDLGTLSWTMNSSTYDYTYFYTGVVDNLAAKALEIPGYVYTGARSTLTADKTCGHYSSSGGVRFAVRDDSVSSASDLKEKLNGVYAVYAFETPTTETADPYVNPQIVDDFGTEEYVDSRSVPIPVGHETLYMANLRDKLQNAPDSPGSDGDYIVRRTNGENTYIPYAQVHELPDAPTGNGTYVLKVTVANGNPTYTWVSE